uniref:Pentraxin family member n=1 Tax=Eptatretus burgeri TaxID=7764 RepID=A0A8C4RBR1_EPTBU
MVPSLFDTKIELCFLNLFWIVTFASTEPETIYRKAAVFQPAARTKFGRATLPTSEVPMENITFCIDLKLTAPEGSLWTVFSYIEPAASRLSLALSGGADGQLILNVANSEVMYRWIPTVNTWHHVCTIWQGAEGVARLFVDGKMAASWVNVARGATIKGGGSVFLGQRVEVLKDRMSYIHTFNFIIIGFLDNENIVPKTEFIENRWWPCPGQKQDTTI